MLTNAYLKMLQDAFYEQAEKRRYTAASEVKIDWGELKFILDEGKHYLQLIDRLQEVYIQSADSKSKDDVARLLGSYVHLIDFNDYEVEQEETCYLCAKKTSIVRLEQYSVHTRDDIRVKCLDCLFEHMKDIQQEAEQLANYRHFVKDKGLEDQLESYLENRNGLNS